MFTIIGGAILFGFIIDSFLPAEWFTFTQHIHAHNHFLPVWLGGLSAIILGGLIINGYILDYFKKKKMKANEFKFDNVMMVQKFKVEGMTCKNCKAHVEKDIAALEGIDGVVADFTSGEVSITGSKVDIEKVKDAVESGGYLFKGAI